MVQKKSRPVDTIWTHPCPHLDEIMAIFLLRKYGQKLFPDVSKAQIEFRRAEGDATGNPEDCEELFAQKILALGTGKGPFDEHDVASTKDGECCATLVAKYLGVAKYPELKQLLAETLANDRNGVACSLSIDLGALYHRDVGIDLRAEDQMSVVDKVLNLTDARWQEQYDFHHTTSAEIRDQADKRTFQIGERTIKVMMIMTDNRQVAKRAFFEGNDVVVIRNDRGHTQVLINNKTLGGVSLENVVRILRIMERRKSGEPLCLSKWSDFGQEGMLFNWHYQVERRTGFQALLNGSTTAPNVEPSVLNREDIFTAIVAGLTDGWKEYEQQFASGQQAKVC